MARPRKPDARRMMLRIRVSTGEYEAIRWRAGAMPVSEWARDTLLACEPATGVEAMRLERTRLREQIQSLRHEIQQARKIRASGPETIFDFAAEAVAVQQSRKPQKHGGRAASRRGMGV